MSFRNDRTPEGESEESTQPTIANPDLRPGDRLSSNPPGPPALPQKAAMPPPLPVSPTLPKPPPLPRREPSSPGMAAPIHSPIAPPPAAPPPSAVRPAAPASAGPPKPVFASKGPETLSYTVPKPTITGSAPAIPPSRPPAPLPGTPQRGPAIPKSPALPTIPGPATPSPISSSASVPLPKEPTITKNLQLKPQDQSGSWRPPPSGGSVRPGSMPPGPLPPAGVEERVQRLATQLPALRESIERHDNDFKALRSRLELADARLGELEEEVRGTEKGSKTIDTLATRVKELEVVAEKVRAGDQALRKMLDSKEKQAEERKGRLGELEDRTAKIEERLASLERTLADRLDRIEKALQSGPPPGDDLRRIKGIGPKFEKALHEMGVRSFAQIAAWTDEDVARIADKLGARIERIQKDGWIAAAKKLAG